MTDPIARDEVLATLAPSPPRCAFGILVMGLLGLLLLWVAIAAPPAHPGWLVMLLAMGGAAFWAAWAMWRAGQDSLILTADTLRTASGRDICRVDEVTGVERGMLAFKPSGGFILRLETRKPGAWVPGLWWRLGRNVGVGGITRSGEGRTMADILAALADGTISRKSTR